MAVKVRDISAVIGKHKTNFLYPDNQLVKCVEIKLTNGAYFDIKTDADGDIVVTSNARIKVLSEGENELIFGLKKQ